MMTNVSGFIDEEQFKRLSAIVGHREILSQQELESMYRNAVAMVRSLARARGFDVEIKIKRIAP